MQKNKCYCCGSSEIKIIYENMRDMDFLKEGNFSILKCENCGLEFLEPMLNEKELEKYYPKEEYYSFNKANKLALIYHNISAYYYSKKSLLFNFLFFLFNPMFYTYYIDKGKNVLEIGCGNGMKLEIYQKYNMNTFGLEPYGKILTEKEKKLGIIRKTINKAGYKRNNFDYIILKEVLEHIPNQKEVLEKCHDWLKPKGKLIITVPNTNGLWNKIFKRNWYGYDVPRHLYDYNPGNIRYFLNKSGFKINKVRVYDMPYMFDGSIKFYLTEKTGKKEHSLVFSNLTKILSAPMSLIITYLKLGSIMEIECEK